MVLFYPPRKTGCRSPHVASVLMYTLRIGFQCLSDDENEGKLGISNEHSLLIKDKLCVYIYKKSNPFEFD
jgi:hypothetical protein